MNISTRTEVNGAPVTCLWGAVKGVSLNIEKEVADLSTKLQTKKLLSGMKSKSQDIGVSL